MGNQGEVVLLELKMVLVFAVFVSMGAVSAFRPGTGPSFAVFGNTETRALIRQWKPNPVDVPSGSVMLPSSTENMKRFVRARILLEQDSASIGCIAASLDGGLSVGTPTPLACSPPAAETAALPRHHTSYP